MADELLTVRGVEAGYAQKQILFGVDLSVRDRRGGRAAGRQRQRQVDGFEHGERLRAPDGRLDKT